MDLTFVLSIVSQYITKPSYTLCTTMKSIMTDLKGSLNLRQYLKRDNIRLHGSCDTNWLRGANDSRSTIGYVFFAEMGAIYLNCKKQLIIIKFIIEVECMEASHGVLKAIWLKLLLEDLRLLQL